MKRIIEIEVRDEYVLWAGVVIGAAGSHDDVILRIAFGRSWAALNIYATFRDALGENPTVILLTPTMRTGGEDMTYDVTIPPTAKRLDGRASLTLTGYIVTSDGVEEDRATNTTTAYFRVLPSDFALADDGSIDATLAQQMLSAMNEHAEVVQTQIGAHEAEVAAQIREHASAVAVEIERQDGEIEDIRDVADEANIYAKQAHMFASDAVLEAEAAKQRSEDAIKAVGKIETALDSIIAIQEELISRSLITFYIDHYGDLGTYQAIEGWTFGDWCGSEYDTLGCRATNYVYAPDGIGIISGGTIQYNPDEDTPIEAEVTYKF